MSQWQVVSILLPATTACVCKLSPRNLPSICPTLARKTEECKFQYDPQNAEIGFAFICLRVSAEEWQGVTATNNVCGDYLPFATTLLLTTITILKDILLVLMEGKCATEKLSDVIGNPNRRNKLPPRKVSVKISIPE